MTAILMTAFAMTVLVSQAALAHVPRLADLAPIDDHQRIRLMLACDEIETGKHLILYSPLSMIAQFSPALDEALDPYVKHMRKSRECAQFSRGYQMLLEVIRARTKSGEDPEQHFRTTEGKLEIEAMILVLRELAK